jgi:hypothetical protein
MAMPDFEAFRLVLILASCVSFVSCIFQKVRVCRFGLNC